MTRMKWIGGVMLCGIMGLASLPVLAESNLCPNGSFNCKTNPIEGWNVNYAWMGNSKYTDNHTYASYLPEYKGRRNVLKMKVPRSIESKVETPLMKYEPGDRYKCTFDLYADVGEVRMLFLGYNWRPGIAAGEAPKIEDMRRIYKGDATSTSGASWKTVTVVFPHEQISELAYSHLKKVKYVTVMLFVPGGTDYVGDFYLTNVKVVKLPGKCTVTKGATKPGSDDND
ncbi:MAG: hypothetical protein WCI03_01355 [bacterium]